MFPSMMICANTRRVCCSTEMNVGAGMMTETGADTLRTAVIHQTDAIVGAAGLAALDATVVPQSAGGGRAVPGKEI